MPDDLDEQIRAAMKTLDEQVPSGYFEAVPNQILARLEDGSMQQSGTSDIRNNRDALMGPPVVEPDTAPVARVDASASSSTKERDEDSGLHDIRNLAQSTKQRLSSRRITVNPPMSDDDILASSSGSWKNIALPQPANMVSLPALENLPSKAEIKAAEKAAKAEKKIAKVSAPAIAVEEAAPIAAAAVTAPAAASVSTSTAAPAIERSAFSLPSQQNKVSKKGLYAVLGVGLAAAAGGVIFMQVSKNDSKQSAAPATQEVATANTAVKAEPIEPPPPAAAPAPEVVAAGSAAEAPVEEPKVDEPVAAVTEDAKAEKKKPAAKGGKKALVEKDEPEKKVEEKPVPEVKKPATGAAKESGGEGEPSFDALLKEAGVEEKKEAKPKLEKKSLAADDFKKGMAAVAGKAQGCYKGTQGTAMVKLTVAPSGQVTKVSVGGAFAGKAEASCVESAVKGASFPPWDGGPQSFSYSYMLSD